MNKQKIWNWSSLGIIAILVTLILIPGCDDEGFAGAIKKILPGGDTILGRDTVFQVDTLREKTLDTVWLEGEKVYLPKIVYRDAPAPADDELAELPTIEPGDSSALVRNEINEYCDSTGDETLTVYFDARTLGHLLDIDIAYKFKKPFQLKETETVTIYETQTITETVYKSGFYSGAGLAYLELLDDQGRKVNDFTYSLDAGYLWGKKGYYLGYSYLPQQKFHLLNLKKRIF